MIRSQYPLSAYEEQLADELGIMLWSEIPAYQVRDTRAAQPSRPPRSRLLRENILDNGNHPSIAIWSVGNELDAARRPVADARTSRATVAAAHALDPTRPVGLAFQGYPSIGCQAGYGPLDVLGINDYFGWYPGPDGQIADLSTVLTDYLAQERACYPKQALMVTEFGAEANRDGPVDERGTYEFQSQFVADAARRARTRPRGSAARSTGRSRTSSCDPGWTGGNPYPTPPRLPQGAARPDGRAQAGVRRRAAGVRGDDADRLSRAARGRFATIPGRMATSTLTRLDVSSRAPDGSRTARRMRREGLVPGVLYGGGGEPVSFAVGARELRTALARAAAPCSSSRSTAAGRRRPCSRTPSATPCAAT